MTQSPNEVVAGFARQLTGLGWVRALGQEHDTWTHGQFIRRRLSGIARAELAQHGYAVFGVQPADVWPSMSAVDIARAAGVELTGYWSWAVRRPWLWLGADHLDLAVTTMLRADRALATGELITKSAALEDSSHCDVPTALVAAVRARRAGRTTLGCARRPLDALASWRLTLYMIRKARADPRLTSRG